MIEKANTLEDSHLEAGEGSYKKKEPKRSIYYIGKFRHQAGAKFTLPELECLADEMLDYMDNPENVWLRSFFTGPERRISPKTIPSLCSQSDYFSFCYQIALSIQEERLVKIGLSKNNATAIFTLKAQHNWREIAEEEADDHILIDFFPSEEDLAEAKELLRDERVRSAMLEIVRQEEKDKLQGGRQ